MVSISAEINEIDARLQRLEDYLRRACNTNPLRGRRPRRKRRSRDRVRAGKRLWNAEDDAALSRRYPHESTAAIADEMRRSLASVYNRAGVLQLQKTNEYLASPTACFFRRSAGVKAGAKFRFTKGHVPANKGLRRPGYAPGRTRETQFRRGERRGAAARLWKPIGAERLSKEGYLERKINNDLPPQKRWRAVHILVWEQANGPVPRGHVIAFKNGVKADIRLENLECITRRELMLRNSVHNLPAELTSAIRMLGVLNRKIRKKERDA